MKEFIQHIRTLDEGDMLSFRHLFLHYKPGIPGWHQKRPLRPIPRLQSHNSRWCTHILAEDV